MSKQEVITMLNNLPDEVVFDKDVLIDALYTAYLRSGIKTGLADVNAGRTQTQEKVEAIFCR